MDTELVRECILSLKPKTFVDRIPQKIQLGGIEHLLPPLNKLFFQIYNQKTIPDQWLIDKMILIYKNKGEPHKLSSNCQPFFSLDFI
jgi:hypothetical protein